MDKTVRFYFSFRSPYSWLATFRIYHLEDKLPVSFDLVPVFPPKDYKNDPETQLHKKDYIRNDVKRIANAYGLNVCFPNPFDTNWIRPHSAFLYANDQKKGPEFILAMYSARFLEGYDIGSDKIMKMIAEKLGLDPLKILKAADDKKFHKYILRGLSQAGDDKIFGVPTFIYGDQMYWGNDRLEWLFRDIYRNTGQTVPNLSDDLFARPY